jgi:hypothetical protein
MFDFLNMAFDQESRKVDHTEINGALIDTCMVTDSTRSYETAVAHPDYGDGSWIIVESYDTKDEAEAGHEKWVKIFTNNLPNVLHDVNDCEIRKLGKALGIEIREIYERKRKTKKCGKKN